VVQPEIQGVFIRVYQNNSKKNIWGRCAISILLRILILTFFPLDAVARKFLQHYPDKSVNFLARSGLALICGALAGP
jgi:hypothetical protein